MVEPCQVKELESTYVLVNLITDVYVLCLHHLIASAYVVDNKSDTEQDGSLKHPCKDLLLETTTGNFQSLPS